MQQDLNGNELNEKKKWFTEDKKDMIKLVVQFLVFIGFILLVFQLGQWNEAMTNAQIDKFCGEQWNRSYGLLGLTDLWKDNSGDPVNFSNANYSPLQFNISEVDINGR